MVIISVVVIVLLWINVIVFPSIVVVVTLITVSLTIKVEVLVTLCMSVTVCVSVTVDVWVVGVALAHKDHWETCLLLIHIDYQSNLKVVKSDYSTILTRYCNIITIEWVILNGKRKISPCSCSLVGKKFTLACIYDYWEDVVNCNAKVSTNIFLLNQMCMVYC